MSLLHHSSLGQELLTPRLARIILLPEAQACAGLVRGAEGLKVDEHTLASLIVIEEQSGIRVRDRVGHVAACLLEDGCGGGGRRETRVVAAVADVLEERGLPFALLVVHGGGAVAVCDNQGLHIPWDEGFRLKLVV